MLKLTKKEKENLKKLSKLKRLTKDDYRLIASLINEKLRRHFGKHPKYNQPTMKKHLEEGRLIKLRYRIERRLYRPYSTGKKSDGIIKVKHRLNHARRVFKE